MYALLRVLFIGFFLLLPLAPSAASLAQVLTPDDVGLPKIFVYMNYDPPYTTRSPAGVIEGERARLITAFLDSTGLDYEIILVPWERAYIAGTTRDNILIANLDRTAARENLFHWLVPLESRVNYLMAPDEPRFRNMTREQVLASSGKAVCVKYSSDCLSLATIGFPPERIWQVADTDGAPMVPLIERGRAVFWLDDVAMLAAEMQARGLAASGYLPLFEVNRVMSYLAASQAIHPEILERLLAAVVRD
jgi:hypothetical protein